MNEERMVELLCFVHEETPRQGPGSRASTLRALELVPDRETRRTVIDVGCGTGAQTLVLAERLPNATVTAVDVHRPFLVTLGARAAEAGLAGRIRTRVGDMAALDVPTGSQDLVWAEGSAFVMGFEEALGAWRPLLAPGGVLALSEVCWFVDEPPPECADFWQASYPAIGSVDDRLRTIGAAGYRVLGHFSLPEEDWLEEYYAPLERRLESLRRDHGDDPELLEVIEASFHEMDVYRRHPGVWGYEMFVLAPAPSAVRSSEP